MAIKLSNTQRNFSKLYSKPKLSFIPEGRYKELSKSMKKQQDFYFNGTSYYSGNKNLIFPEASSTASFKNRESKMQINNNHQLDSIEKFRQGENAENNYDHHD